MVGDPSISCSSGSAESLLSKAKQSIGSDAFAGLAFPAM